MVMTRRQTYLSAALAHMKQVKEGQPDRTQRIYGGLCHKLPMLLRTNGLCQTVALIEAKSSGKPTAARPTAYRLLREHMAATLKVTPQDLATRVASAPAPRYLQDTRALLEAWAYYKRFAVSILDVQAGEDVEEEDEEEEA